jgi:hypothetical protein
MRELYQRIGQLEMELEWLKKNDGEKRSQGQRRGKAPWNRQAQHFAAYTLNPMESGPKDGGNLTLPKANIQRPMPLMNRTTPNRSVS